MRASVTAPFASHGLRMLALQEAALNGTEEATEDKLESVLHLLDNVVFAVSALIRPFWPALEPTWELWAFATHASFPRHHCRRNICR
jgi:hypothetical protein